MESLLGFCFLVSSKWWRPTKWVSSSMSPLMLRHNCLTIIQSHTESRESKNGTPTRIFRRGKFFFWWFYMNFDRKMFYSVVTSYELCTFSLIFTRNRVIFRHLLSHVFTTVSTYCRKTQCQVCICPGNSRNTSAGPGENFDPFSSI